MHTHTHVYAHTHMIILAISVNNFNDLHPLLEIMDGVFPNQPVLFRMDPKHTKNKISELY